MKLRQKSALVLCVFYLVSVIGIALSLHFCGGKLSSVHFTETAMCSACKMKSNMSKSSKCCTNTDVKAKITDSHQTGSKISLPQNFGLKLFLIPVFSGFVHYILPKIFSRVENKAPPLSARVSLYAYNCVFRN